MNKDDLLTAFNDHFKEFIDDVKFVFPKNTDITTLSKGLSSIYLLNKKMIIKSFKSNFVDVYRTQIENGDINFFIDLDYKNDLTNLGIEGSKGNAILEKINCLKGPIRLMNPDEQASVMKYMKNLMGLCEMYYSM